MNRTSNTRPENRGGKNSPAPRDHYQEVTDRIIAALEAGTPPWRRPWDPDKAGGPAMPRNAATGQRYRGINVLTLACRRWRSRAAIRVGRPTSRREERGWQVAGERGTTGYFFKRLELRDSSCRCRFLVSVLFGSSCSSGCPSLHGFLETSLPPRIPADRGKGARSARPEADPLRRADGVR